MAASAARLQMIADVLKSMGVDEHDRGVIIIFARKIDFHIPFTKAALCGISRCDKYVT